jgi:cytosine/adenosine deaminase-related metal-dependent hydrolase
VEVTESEYVVAGTWVVSMDAEIGELPVGDIHVRDGEIVAVGPSLDVAAPRLDGAGMIAMPGLVDTHTHLWTTLFRAMSSSSPETAYFPLNVAHGRRCEPDDLFHGVRLGLVDAVHHGITTVHDWAHNLRSPAHTDANLRAHEAVGLRGRFSYGVAQGHPVDTLGDLDDVVRVRADWFASSRLPLMHLGLAGRQPGLVPREVYRPEYDAALAAGLPVSYHVNATRAHGALEMVRQLGEEGMLTPATQLVHALYTSETERAMIRESGASVSLSPWSELLIGYGVPPVRQLDRDGILLGLSADTLSLTGSGDPWSTIRLATGLYRAQAEQELVAPTRRMLELATIDAARCLGLDHLVGSLTPGKRADLILVRTHDLATAPVTDVTNTLALAVGPENVDTVIVDGRIRKQGGHLTDLDIDEVVRQAEQALTALLSR